MMPLLLRLAAAQAELDAAAQAAAEAAAAEEAEMAAMDAQKALEESMMVTAPEIREAERFLEAALIG